MEDATQKTTRFLLEAARTVYRKNELLDKMIVKIQKDVEVLDQVKDQMFDEITEQFRNEIFTLNNALEDTKGARPRDWANDIMSNFFEDMLCIDEARDKLNEQLSIIKKDTK
jgi:GTP1/Obg family GTP-binding protein